MSDTAIPASRWQLEQMARAEIRTIVKTILDVCLSDQLAHAELIAAGPYAFRVDFVREVLPAGFHGKSVEVEALARVIFQFLHRTWYDRYPYAPGTFLDQVQMQSAPTEQEIEDAWELEIGSSDAAMRTLYEGSGRTRKGADIFRAQPDLRRVID